MAEGSDYSVYHPLIRHTAFVLSHGGQGGIQIGKMSDPEDPTQYLTWSEYIPGQCIICETTKAALIWQGVRSGRNSLPKKTPAHGAREGPGDCRVTMCDVCFAEVGIMANIVRKDHTYPPGKCCRGGYIGLTTCDRQMYTCLKTDVLTRTTSILTKMELTEIVRHQCTKKDDKGRIILTAVKQEKGIMKPYKNTQLGDFIADTWQTWRHVDKPFKYYACPITSHDWATDLSCAGDKPVTSRQYERKLEMKWQGEKKTLQVIINMTLTEAGTCCAASLLILQLQPGQE